MLAIVAGVLEAWLIFSLFPDITLPILVATFPFLYVVWLFLFISISSLDIALLFSFFEKPKTIQFNHKITTIKELILLIKYLPTMIAYRRKLLIDTLPFINYVKLPPITLLWIRNLVMRSYAPKIHIGEKSIVVPWLEDPDLTYIGDQVVIGSECSIVAHALNISNGQLKYTSEPIVIGNYSTIGGNSRIGIGVKIDEGGIVEAGSNVLPYTRIGRGEVWGGNPAVLIRKRHEYSDSPEVQSSVQQINQSELNAIIANAIHLPPEEITDELDSYNCMAWDSLAKMAIAASLYDRFAIRVPPREIFKLDSRKSIEELIFAHTNNDLPDSSVAESPPDGNTNAIPANPELLPLYPPETVTQALARLSQEEVVQGQAKKTIVVAATFTVQPLGSTLELWCRAFQMPFSVEFAEFNQLEQTLLSPNSDFINNQNGLNVVLTRPEDLISDGDPDGMIRAGQLLEAIISYASRKKGLIVSNLPPVVSPFFQGKDLQVEKLRLWWQEQLEKIEGIHILDFKSVVEEVGRQNASDASLEVIARAPYSQTVYQKLGIAITRLVRSIFLPAKKVLALDCDNTLWGGVVGEDGIDGLALSNDYPGRSFRLFQEMVLDLKKGGVLLVLVSKNEEADVWNVFEHHPEMILRRGDIAGHRINWQKKSANLRELAKELNLGLDSFVFMDDSPVERLEVETNTPEVTVVPMPKDPAHYAETLSKLWCFDSASLTAEDTIRTQLMVQEQQRRDLQQSVSNLENYLESLELVAEIRLAEERDLPRVAQLTQKTNQFNLSLIRRSLPEIQEIQKSSSILVLSLKDRFGDYGLVGVGILKPENGSLLLDTFLMSCRALGRGVEEAFLYTMFDFATQKDLKRILAPFHSGPRNEQVKTFLLNMGFEQKQSDLLEAEVANSPKKPGHVKMLVNVLV
ncbi:hypothetical protein BJP34_09655 [Moorena producens PAL-8-15-08-1]|uniref:Uncharacterized protein n=1 Tax=Moorena producens PAL-8-15-08-1 TaxID=1458985 RepID=A0A1D8TPW3_9CYAN|nr:HAD-IIIC family phosphatase [Moorena producens]AOW99687.1 hypothetical protein BJP34_09655 [Moorena producens PAL-8-15-08-1]